MTRRPGVVERALVILFDDPTSAGVVASIVGARLWPERTGKCGVSADGGGDYPAQMLLGRMRKMGLARVRPGPGTSRWMLTGEGKRRAVRVLQDAVHARTRTGAVVSSTDPCTCGHAPEEHGHDAKYPGSTNCTECDCIAFEATEPAS